MKQKESVVQETGVWNKALCLKGEHKVNGKDNVALYQKCPDTLNRDSFNCKTEGVLSAYKTEQCLSYSLLCNQ